MLDWKVVAARTSGDAPATGGASISLPIGDTREAFRYGNVYGEEALRNSLIAYREYRSYVERCNEAMALRRELVAVEQLIAQDVR